MCIEDKESGQRGMWGFLLFLWDEKGQMRKKRRNHTRKRFGDIVWTSARIRLENCWRRKRPMGKGYWFFWGLKEEEDEEGGGKGRKGNELEGMTGKWRGKWKGRRGMRREEVTIFLHEEEDGLIAANLAGCPSNLAQCNATVIVQQTTAAVWGEWSVRMGMEAIMIYSS
jgi:hypothetical protein